MDAGTALQDKLDLLQLGLLGKDLLVPLRHIVESGHACFGNCPPLERGRRIEAAQVGSWGAISSTLFLHIETQYVVGGAC